MIIKAVVEYFENDFSEEDMIMFERKIENTIKPKFIKVGYQIDHPNNIDAVFEIVKVRINLYSYPAECIVFVDQKE